MSEAFLADPVVYGTSPELERACRGGEDGARDDDWLGAGFF